MDNNIKKNKIKSRNYIRYKGSFKDSSGETVTFVNEDEKGRMNFHVVDNKKSKATVSVLVLLFSIFTSQSQFVTNCASTLISNVHSVEYAAYITPASNNAAYSSLLYIQYGTNFVVPVDNGNKRLNITNPPCFPAQIWGESDGTKTKITSVDCSSLAVYNNDNLNHRIQITRDFMSWSDVLVSYNIIKVPTDESFGFFRIKVP